MIADIIIEPNRETPLVKQCDVLICGGGPAGIAAAIASAASEAKTILLETAGCLGGIWTAGLASYVLDPKTQSPVTELLMAELDRRNARRYPFDPKAESLPEWGRKSFLFDPEVMKRVLESLLLRCGVEVQLYTRVCGVTFKEGKGRHLASVFSESPTGREAWGAKVFVDATGNGDIGFKAGCRFKVNRPFEEETPSMTLMALITSPFPERLRPFAWGAKQGRSLSQEMKERGIPLSLGDPVLSEVQEGLFAFMMNYQPGNALKAKDRTLATFQARVQIHEAVETLHQSGGDWEGVRVVTTADQIGIREGRRLLGLYEMSKEDLLSGRKHLDAICEVHFPIDRHSEMERPAPFDEEDWRECRSCEIPLRAVISADVDNLLMAGRCISGDFPAPSSYRVTGNALALGEAAGCLAAMTSRSGKKPREVSWEEYLKIRTSLRDRLQNGMPTC